MNVQTLLDQAAQCKTSDDAHNLVLAMQDAFTSNGAPLGHLHVHNPDWSMEDTGPFARFEFIRTISPYYLTTIRPEIREGKFSLVVVTNYVPDGAGAGSQNVQAIDLFDEEAIESDGEHALEELAVRAVELAIADHRLLIERAGVPEAIAQDTAQKSW